MVEMICKRLQDLGLAKYAQEVIREVLLEVASGSYHDIPNPRVGLRQLAIILRDAAVATLHDNGFLATATLVQHLSLHRPTHPAFAEVIDDLVARLNSAAAKHTRSTNCGRH